MEVLEQINSIKKTVTRETTPTIPYFMNNHREIKHRQKQVIQEQIQFDQLVQSSVHVLPGTNHIYIDYPILKLFANPDNYTLIVDFIIHRINDCIRAYGNFNIHVNIHTFSVTACQRFMPIIRLFLQKCNDYNTEFSSVIQNMYIYNTPATISNISTMLNPFISIDLRKNMIFYDKINSETMLARLFSRV